MTAIDCEVAKATLLRDSELIGEITADNNGQHGSFPPGPLSPGIYQIVLQFSVLFDQTSGEADRDFNFSGAITVGEAVPTNEIEWNNSAGGAFHTATNWDPQMVPGTNDTAIFGLESAYSVDVGAATTERLELRSGDVTLTTADYTVSSIVFDPAGILLDNAKLTLASQSVLRGVHALIGESAAARVDVVTGGLVLSGSLRVGGPGNGILDIEDGGIVLGGEGRIGNGVGGGTVTVTGAASGWGSGNLSVGHSGNGTLTISDGAGVTSVAGFVGFGAGMTGTVTIQGFGSDVPTQPSNWTLTGDLHIGEGGVGVLNALDGAKVTCPNMNLGISAPGTALVTGIGTEPSLVDVANLLIVGEANSGILNVEDGAEVRIATGIFVGYSETGIGTINVVGKSPAGPSLLDTLGDILVGFDGGTGFLNIKEDATVISDGAGVDPNSRVELGVDGAPGNPASWSVSDDLLVGSVSGTGPAVVALHNGAIVTVGVKLTIFGNGSICGNGTYSAPIVENNGTVCPGNSAGTLVIDGDYTQTSVGKLLMEMAGPDPGQFDVLHVTGASVLDGTMEVQMLGNFLPAAGQTFDLLQLDGSVTGDFSEITFPDLKPDFEFSAEQVGGVFKITALNDGLAANALLNISTRAQVGTGDNVLIAGFIVQGNEPKTVLLRGIGPSLTAFGVSGALANPTLELRDSDGELIFSNDDWMDSPQKQQIIDSTIPPADDLESAILATLDPGAYTTILRGANDGTGVGLLEVYDLAQDASVNMLNISTRGDVQTGDDVMIAGFIATGTTQILTRAIGPSLTEAGLANVLADPTLEVFDANGATLLANDNWKDSQQSEIEATAIPPPSDLESAALMTLEAGAYTIIVRGANETSGIGLVEVYKL
jgi:T5SS/PEP-CTERM-associated repeat protein